MTRLADAQEPIGLRSPRHRVERRAIGWWLLRALALVVPLLTGLALGYALLAPARPWLGPPLAAGAGEYQAPDLDAGEAVWLADRAVPDLLSPFRSDPPEDADD